MFNAIMKPKSIPNPNPNVARPTWAHPNVRDVGHVAKPIWVHPNVWDVAKPTWAHPNVRDVAKPAWAHPNVLDVATGKACLGTDPGR